MIHGCAGLGGKDKPKLELMPQIETTPIRCPPAAKANLDALRSRVAPPKPDVQGPDGKPYVSVGALQDKTGELLVDNDAKARAGLAINEDLERCRNGGKVDLAAR